MVISGLDDVVDVVLKQKTAYELRISDCSADVCSSDRSREGLVGTPDRLVRSYREFFAGYDSDPVEILKRTFEEIEGYDEMVVLRDIRSEESRVGKECARTCRSRWSTDHKNITRIRN